MEVSKMYDPMFLDFQNVSFGPPMNFKKNRFETVDL